MLPNSHSKPGILARVDLSTPYAFKEPTKRINEGEDVTFFLASEAYTDIVTFLLQLTASMFPRRTADGKILVWEMGSPTIEYSPAVSSLRDLLGELYRMIDDYPPDTGPRRFGNVAFRAWCAGVEENMDKLLDQYLPDNIHKTSGGGDTSPKIELKAYFLGSWGSAQRLDYGTGHELSFLAFLGCLWKLGAFGEGGGNGVEERGIVLGVMEPYLALVRRLILTYTLEPAGSHGVWGLDDHFFVPYIFGSAQLAPAIESVDNIPTEGSLNGAPNPADVTKAPIVERERKKNMYFNAVGFINDVKKGPFWEHSPILYDVSGVTKGWAKINKGMIKMYIAEVLSKFPVVQHFPFGSLFKWERDPNAGPTIPSAHVASHATASRTQQQPLAGSGAATAAPWLSQTIKPNLSRSNGVVDSPTQAPWAAQARVQPLRSALAPTQRPLRPVAATMMPPSRAPWASQSGQTDPARNTDAVVTKAPWAK